MKIKIIMLIRKKLRKKSQRIKDIDELDTIEMQEIFGEQVYFD